MAKICEICGKGFLKGNLVCFSNKKSIKRSYPNLRKIKLTLNGTSARLKICASCLSIVKKTSQEKHNSESTHFHFN